MVLLRSALYETQGAAQVIKTAWAAPWALEKKKADASEEASAHMLTPPAGPGKAPWQTGLSFKAGESAPAQALPSPRPEWR